MDTIISKRDLNQSFSNTVFKYLNDDAVAPLVKEREIPFNGANAVFNETDIL
mgnify:CR=1 FL=1